MSQLRQGDKVAVLNDTIKGVVLSVDKNLILIEDEDGFEREYRPKELVFLAHDDDYKVSDTPLKDLDEVSEIKSNIVTPSRSSNEIDLHIECLVDNHSGWTNHDILNRQMNVCRSFIRKAIKENRKKIVLIHGKGEGVLKSEIRVYLSKLKNQDGYQLTYHDGDFSEYGMGGATEVIFYKF